MAGIPTHQDAVVSQRFRLGDFRHSEVIPRLSRYRLNAIQWENVQAIARNILEPMWDQWGQVIVTSGGRPNDLTDEQGRTFYELLKDEGFSPVKQSQHADFSAVDIKLLKRRDYKPAFLWLKRHPAVRQVILYVDDEGYPRRMHVGIITPIWPGTTPKALLFAPDAQYVVASPTEIRERVRV